MDDPEAWLLSAVERGNPHTTLPAWTAGNLVEPLVHGSAYFDRLVDEVRSLDSGDHLFFTDWRGDPDERLREDGPTVAELFTEAVKRGVCVRGLVWRSHMQRLSLNKESNRALDREIEHGGGEVILDQRIRRMGSHHQKFVVLRHDEDPSRDVAFVGGIDLCHSPPRRRRPPRRSPAAADGRGLRADIRRGTTCSCRSAAPRSACSTRCSASAGRTRTVPTRTTRSPGSTTSCTTPGCTPTRCRPSCPPPPECGPHLVQTLRTYPAIRPPYDFAPDGERSVARGYTKAITRARRLIYLEDQYMWSAEVARLFAEALRDHPDLHLVVVVPRFPDQDGAFAERPADGRPVAGDRDVPAGPGEDRVHVFDVENHEGTPVYVHAKVCVVDDVWASVGSDNFNRRSWTHDSELSSAVLDTTRDPREPRDPAGTGDGARIFARDLRLTLAREHLDLPADGSEDDDLLDPERFVRRSSPSATALDAWHEGGRKGPRPPGRLRAAPGREAAAVHPAVGHPGLPPARRPRRPAVAAAPQKGF